jgi:hypothetical protein
MCDFQTRRTALETRCLVTLKSTKSQTVVMERYCGRVEYLDVREIWRKGKVNTSFRSKVYSIFAVNGTLARLEVGEYRAEALCE